MQLAGFTDYFPTGIPYIGIVATDGTVQCQIIIGDKQNARHNVNEICAQLRQLVHDVENMPEKLVEVKGDISGLRIPQGGKSLRTQARGTLIGTRGTRPQGSPEAGIPPLRPGQGSRAQDYLPQPARTFVLAGYLWYGFPMTQVTWDAVVPTFSNRLREPKRPEKPSDGAIAMAQKSYDGFIPEGSDETWHAITHRFPTVEMAADAADELKRAGAYTTPETTVTVLIDPEGKGDNRVVRWRAGGKRGRKA
jgi:hypothetical protein